MASIASTHWAAPLFRGLPENALLESLRVVALCNDRSLEPEGYVDVWRPPAQRADGDCVPEYAPDEDAGLLICSNVCEDAEYETLRELLRDICSREEPPQLLLLLPRSPPVADATARLRYKERLQVLLEDGFDDVIPFQPSGFGLCLQVHAKVTATRQRLESGLRLYHKRRLLAHQQAKAKHIVEFTMWNWLPKKVTRMIPRMRRDLHPEPLQDTVAGHTLVKRLGGGFYGHVYAAVASAVAEAAANDGVEVVPTEAMKVVDKSGLFGMREIKMLHHMITVHNLLSSPRLQHPNIVMLRNVYHSPTHLFFHMEYAGPENLYARLAASGHMSGVQEDECAVSGADDSPQSAKAAKHRPITCDGLRGIFAQTTAAVAHLHLNAGACHRDLKLENFVVEAGTGGPAAVPRIKLVDFDFARLVQEPLAFDPQPGSPAPERRRCHGKCGTVPYVAPEVACERSYDGMAADVWSLGVLFLETLCGVRVMENTFDIEHKAHFSGGEGVAQVAERIRCAFEKPGYAAQLMEAKARPEAQDMLHPADLSGGPGVLLNLMLAVNAEFRLGMAEVQQLVDSFAGPSEPGAALTRSSDEA